MSKPVYWLWLSVGTWAGTVLAQAPLATEGLLAVECHSLEMAYTVERRLLMGDVDAATEFGIARRDTVPVKWGFDICNDKWISERLVGTERSGSGWHSYGFDGATYELAQPGGVVSRFGSRALTTWRWLRATVLFEEYYLQMLGADVPDRVARLGDPVTIRWKCDSLAVESAVNGALRVSICCINSVMPPRYTIAVIESVDSQPVLVKTTHYWGHRIMRVSVYEHPVRIGDVWWPSTIRTDWYCRPGAFWGECVPAIAERPIVQETLTQHDICSSACGRASARSTGRAVVFDFEHRGAGEHPILSYHEQMPESILRERFAAHLRTIQGGRQVAGSPVASLLLALVVAASVAGCWCVIRRERCK
jgi:hypothetical protein